MGPQVQTPVPKPREEVRTPVPAFYCIPVGQPAADASEVQPAAGRGEGGDPARTFC